MNLLDALRQYISDASPRGLLNPEVPEDAPQEVAKGLLGLTPGVGDAISGYDAIQSARAANSAPYVAARTDQCGLRTISRFVPVGHKRLVAKFLPYPQRL